MRRYRIFPFILAAAIIAALLLVLHFLFPGALSKEGHRLQLVSLILVASYLLLGVGSRNWKSSDVMRAVMGWSAIAIVLLLGYSFRHDLKPLWDRLHGELLPTQARTTDNGRVEIAKTRNRHFEVQASVNGVNLLFLVDTGATNVTLSQADAKRVGINVSRLNYNIPTSTASGRSWAAAVTLDFIKIGSIRVENVKANVAKSGLEGSLLGMSFLSRLQSYSVEQGKMVLKQ